MKDVVQQFQDVVYVSKVNVRLAILFLDYCLSLFVSRL